MVYLLEVLLVRLGLYLIGAPAVMLDLVAYIGYKFVPLCINMGGKHT
jgi:YIF1